MEGLLIVVVIVLIIIVFVLNGTNRRLDKIIQSLKQAAFRDFDADTEEAVVKLLASNNYWKAKNIACKEFNMTDDAFEGLYAKLRRDGRLKFKLF